MITGDRELLGELRRLSQALGLFADGIFADSLSAAEQRGFSCHLTNVPTGIRERVEQKTVDNSWLAFGDTP
jgi:hypothetical protein